MRALLVVNHQATTTSQRSRDVLIRALRSAVDLEVAYTRRRGHAVTLAQEAAAAGVELVVVHGGDGTVNEAVNGLMAGGARAADRPALAVVPGGSTNVFARALGLPADWAEATGVILEALRERRNAGRPLPGQVINLGRADQRYFTFCAGLGIDAAVVQRVEQARLRGRGATPGRYLRAVLGQLVLPRHRSGGITVEVDSPTPPEPDGGRGAGAPGDGARVDGLATVIVQNTSPWTYLGERPINLNPGASFTRGLDLLGLRTLRIATAARTIGQMMSRHGAPHGRQVVRLPNLTAVTLRAVPGQPFQVDGEYLGEQTLIKLTVAPQALRVLS